MVWTDAGENETRSGVTAIRPRPVDGDRARPGGAGWRGWLGRRLGVGGPCAEGETKKREGQAGQGHGLILSSPLYPGPARATMDSGTVLPQPRGSARAGPGR